jgi:RNA polymerase sigma-70 factor (ECF subfamily)
MSEVTTAELNQLLKRAAGGDQASWTQLVTLHHDRLRRMVALRLDPRLQGRIDPSDVLQETYLEAASGLAEHLRESNIPFYLWLRLLAGSRLARAHRTHLGTGKRTVGREVPITTPVPEASSVVLADCLISPGDRPSEATIRAEERAGMQRALERLDANDRELLALRHYEQMTTPEIGQVLGISTAAASKRYLRALERLRAILQAMPGGNVSVRP